MNRPQFPMYKLRVYSVGKTKEQWLEQAIIEYKKRLQNVLEIEFIWAKSDNHLIELVSKETLLVCLDPKGSLLDSVSFSRFIMKKFEEGGSRLAIVIGGAEGLPADLKGKWQMISLSPLTYTHQLTRLVIIEQLYRAFEIDRGSAYHK